MRGADLRPPEMGQGRVYRAIYTPSVLAWKGWPRAAQPESQLLVLGLFFSGTSQILSYPGQWIRNVHVALCLKSQEQALRPLNEI